MKYFVILNFDRFNQALFRKLGDMGLLGITVPEEYGGAGADVTAACIVHEELVSHPFIRILLLQKSCPV
jgi:alkylation response protein AidB-like acyl-CoA dehydrogenase